MSQRASIISLALVANTPRNEWLRSDTPTAELCRETIAKASLAGVELQELLDLVQFAFEAGCAFESRESSKSKGEQRC